MNGDLEQRLRHLYAAFNARDLEAALQGLCEHVKWANGMDGGYLEGRAAVRSYWQRQWLTISSEVSPISFKSSDSRVVVAVRQVVHSVEGELLSDGRVVHAHDFRDGKITHFQIVKEEDR